MASPSDREPRQRFAFGRNWSGFIKVLDEDRIREAEQSLQVMLEAPRLDGLTFLDVGSGSGLLSLAARRLEARVHSFDFDPLSVATTGELKRRFAPAGGGWSIEHGSVLDRTYLHALGQYDIVYSWGMLHHTGYLRQAMENVSDSVAAAGRLFIAIYNDRGLVSDFWRGVKRLYGSGPLGRAVVIPVFFTIFTAAGLAEDLVRWKSPLRRYTEYRRRRGMSIVHDWIDWLGGYPYEVATPGEVFDFYSRRGFSLIRLKTRPTLGCNEYLFRRADAAHGAAASAGSFLHPRPGRQSTPKVH